MGKTQRRYLVVGVLIAGIVTNLSGQSTTHIVEPDQTIYSIARRYGVPQALIIAANDISDPRNISVGTSLVIPGTYEVRRGDSYYGIARRFGVELESLLDINGREVGSILREGEVLLLPPEADDAAGVENRETPPDISDSRDMVLERNVDSSTGGTTPSWPIAGARTPMSGKLPGVMIRGRIGDEVLSIASGRVRYTGPYYGLGRVVIVQSPEGYIYVYGGAESLVVNIGDIVRPGSALGLLGEGTSDEPALYFGVWKGETPVPPESAPRG